MKFMRPARAGRKGELHIMLMMLRPQGPKDPCFTDFSLLLVCTAQGVCLKRSLLGIDTQPELCSSKHECHYKISTFHRKSCVGKRGCVVGAKGT